MTLIEFIVASMIAAVLALAMVPLSTAPHQMWRQGEERIELQRELSLALKAIADRLREAKWTTVSADGAEISFQNDETEARLFVRDNQLLVSEGNDETVLADCVKAVHFVPYASRVEIRIDMQLGAETVQGDTSAALRGIDLIGRWPFEEGAGEDIATFDTSASGNNGALHNTLWSYDSTQGRDVLHFRASGLDDPGFSYVQIPDTNALDVGQRVVFEFQIKSLGFETATPTLFNRGVPHPEQAFQWVYLDSTGGSLVFFGSNGTGYQSVSSGSLEWETGRWYRVVLLLDNQKKLATFWRNGQLVQSVTYTVPFLMGGATGSGYLGIARAEETGELDSGSAWNGEMNEVTIGNY